MSAGIFAIFDRLGHSKVLINHRELSTANSELSLPNLPNFPIFTPSKT